MRRQQTLSSQFGLTSGIRQASSDFVSMPRPEHAGRGSSRRGKLWILTEPASSTGGASAAAKLVMEAIEDEYYQSPAPSITTALEEAVSAANRLLHDYNSGAPLHKQAFLGVTCVVQHGKDAYFAQVQPGRTIIVHQGTPRTFPDGPPKSEADLTPLGLEADVVIELHRSPFSAGDTISVLSSGLAHLIRMTEDEYGLSYQDYTGAIEQLHHMAVRNNLLDEHALVIEEPTGGSAISKGASFQAIGHQWMDKVASKAKPSLKPDVFRFSRIQKGSGAGEAEAGRAGGRLFSMIQARGAPTLRAPGLTGKMDGRLRIAATALGVCLLLLLAGGLGLRTYHGYQRSARFESLIKAAEQERAQARGKPTERALQHLKSARDYVTDAKRLNPAHARINTELDLIEADWDIVNRVVLLSKISTAASLQGYKTGSAARVVVVNKRALVLSRPAGTVYMYDLKRRQGSKLSPKKSVRFTGLSWRTGGVLMLDRTGKIYDYDLSSGQWSSTKLGGKQPWPRVVAFDTYNSKAYVVFRGRPGVVVYNMDSPRRGKTMKLGAKGKQMAPSNMSVAGSVWLTSATDDSIWKVVNGKVRRRLWVEAEPRVEEVSGLLALDSNKSLYMLDKRRSRVLQVSTSGQLEAQFQFAPSFKGTGRIDAMYVDEKAGRVYVVVGRTLYSAPLPGVAKIGKG